jgi:hypothetical protein
MKRALLVFAVVIFVVLWGAASWVGGRLYGCEPPTCQLWPDGPLMFAGIGAVLITALVTLVVNAKRRV